MIQMTRPEWPGGRRILWLLVSTGGVFALLILAAFESLSFHWTRIGVGPYLVVEYVRPNGPGERAGIQPGDRILRIGDRRVYTRNHYELILHTQKVGKPYKLTVQRGSEILNLEVTGEPDPDQITVLILPIIGIAFLSIGSIVGFFRFHDLTSRLFFWLSYVLAMSYGFVYGRSPIFSLLSFAGFMVPSLAVHLALVFPVHRPWADKTWIRVLLYLPAVVLILLSILTSVGILRVELFYARHFIEEYEVIGAAIALLILIYTTITARQPLIRQQVKWIIWGLSIAVLANGVYTVFERFGTLRNLIDINLVNWLTLVVPLSFAFSIVRYRLFDVDTVINRTIVYTIVVVSVLVLYMFSIQLLQAVGLDVYYDNPGFITILVILVSVLLDPLRQQIQRIVDRVMYRRRPDYRQVMQEMSREIVSTIDLNRLLTFILERLYQVTQSERIAIFLLDERQGGYQVVATLGNVAPVTLLAPEHPVVRALHKQQTLLQMPDVVADETEVADEIERFMHRAGLVLCLPLRTGDQLRGWIGLGIRERGELYALDERHFLLMLAEQAAIAIHNALLYRRSQEQARQLEILHHIDSILTSTLELDVLVRNFLTQVVEILGVEAASLLLCDPDREVLVFRGAVGPGHDVLSGTSISLHSRSIASWVADTGQPVLSNDVRSDSRWYSEIDRLIGFTTRQLIGVPILQREQVIGVIEILNRRDGKPFTGNDLDLGMMLARQISMAIENAQLYASTDKALTTRVHELATMQEIDRQLNGKLDFDRVIRLTLQWAIKLTASDAGFIGLVEDRSEGRQVVISAAEGYPTVVEGCVGSLRQGMLGQVFDQANPINVAQVVEPDVCWPQRPSVHSRLVAPIMYEEQVIGVISLESDKPQHYSAQEETMIVRLADHAAIAIENAFLYRELERANQSKSEFVELVAHELKAPMTIIKGYAELLQMSLNESAAEESKLLGTIVANVERMQVLIKELLELAQLESSAVKLDRSPLPMHLVLAEAITGLRGMIDEYGIQLAMNVPAELPYVYADQVRLGQILTNLISNAIKYTPAGKSVLISAEVCDSPDDEMGGQRYVRCSVCDQGIGISEEDQAKLFSRFFRANHPYVRKRPGTGLGLSIAKMLVELHQGQIGFSSELGQGSTFWFTIPVAEWKAQAVMANAS